MAARRRLWRSVRARATLGATAVVAVALVVGGFIFVAALSSSLEDASARAGEVRAEELASRVEAEGPGAIRALEDEVAQLVDADGDVVAASEDAPSTALPHDDPAVSSVVDGEPVLVVSEELDDGSSVLVGISVEDDAEAVATVVGLLLVAVPLLVLLVGTTTWLVVGRALAPVTRIRTEVESITADRLDRRVPVPSSGDELAALAMTMNGMLERLDASAQAQRRFVSDASHELRSPLATIRQHAELSQAHPEVTSVEELAGIVHEEGLRLQGLVDALLLLARLDEGAAVAHEAVDLDDIALVEVSRLRASGIVVDGSGVGPAQVSGDGRLLGQLARNLADNAARHAAGRVAIGVAARDGFAVLTVEDDGDGVPPDERERIFERFVRLDEARSRDAGGSGLGLPIVRAIADAVGGRVAVDDSRWGGARFTVTLPVAS
ncbi:HAMP domain-containing sensor histidine kinase [Microbacterium sp. 2FI]|uniref:sensor histidine kinase n=1 Tax=Microbacterium sp. 2FI TaxID=2502193 RepID=UPI0010F59D24|nr:HAMP domain-containing sensor histidine kinase [Microbacterium sp. 2FI]